VFFFQAEDGIRDGHVTGVQTCALPISSRAAGGIDLLRAEIDRTRRDADAGWRSARAGERDGPRRTRSVVSDRERTAANAGHRGKIGRASCRERVGMWVGGGTGDEEDRM